LERIAYHQMTDFRQRESGSIGVIGDLEAQENGPFNCI
jgi:hypothetical protein